MKRTIHMCTWLALASLTGIYSCSGEDDPTPAPTDMADNDVGGSGDGDDGNDEPEPTGLVQGAPCTEDGEACARGLMCVEGVCCDEACDGVCQSCRGDVSGGFDGTCTSLPAGDEIIIEAEDYEDCPGVQTCDGNGACFARSVGESCDFDSQCDSGFCTDGVCCDARCAGACESCSTGTCSDVTTGTDPGTCESQCTNDGCTGTAIGDPCATDVECGSGICEEVCVLADDNVCTGNSECLNTCIEGRCQSVSAPSQPCDPEDAGDCQAGLVCRSSRCLIPSGDDRPCSSVTECEQDLCFQGICSDLLVEGEACEEDIQCSSPEDFVCRPPNNPPSGPLLCRNATGHACDESRECPGMRACDSESFRGARLCYDTEQSVSVTPWISVGAVGAEVTAVLDCPNGQGFRNTSQELRLVGNGETRRVAADAIDCAVGGVARLLCSVVSSPGDEFRVLQPDSLTETALGDNLVGPAWTVSNLALNGGTTTLVIEESGSAPCLFGFD